MDVIIVLIMIWFVEDIIVLVVKIVEELNFLVMIFIGVDLVGIWD